MVTVSRPAQDSRRQHAPGQGSSPLVGPPPLPPRCSGSARPASPRPGTAQGCLPSVHRPLLEHPVAGAERVRDPRLAEVHPGGALSESVQGLPVPHPLCRTSAIPPNPVCPAEPPGGVGAQTGICPPSPLSQQVPRWAAAAWCRPWPSTRWPHP